MIKHIVCWTFKDFAEDASGLENAEKMKKWGYELIDKVDVIESLEMSMKILDSSTIPTQLVLQTTHKTAEDLSAYQMHPEHKKLGEFAKKVTASRQAIDYEI